MEGSLQRDKVRKPSFACFTENCLNLENLANFRDELQIDHFDHSDSSSVKNASQLKNDCLQFYRTYRASPPRLFIIQPSSSSAIQRPIVRASRHNRSSLHPPVELNPARTTLRQLNAAIACSFRSSTKQQPRVEISDRD